MEWYILCFSQRLFNPFAQASGLFNEVPDLPADALAVEAVLVDKLGGRTGLTELVAHADAGEAEGRFCLLGEEAFGDSTAQAADDAVFLGCNDFPGLCGGSQDHFLIERLDGGHVDAVGRAIREAGMAHQTSVISFEEYPEILDLIRADIVDCTIGGNLVEQGRKGLSILVDYLVYGQKPKKDTVYMDAKILVKESL